MKEEKLWQLVSLKLSGEASPEELSELNRLITESADLAFRIHFLEEFWKSKQQDNSDTDNAFNKHLHRLSNHTTAPELQYRPIQDSPSVSNKKSKFTKSRILLFAGVAASLFIILSLVYNFSGPVSAGKVSQNIVATKPGSKSKIILPDGTQVWLNSESKLIYDKKFGENTREVALTGEAFFDVVKDVTRPFIIHTKTIDVKVLGTAFNVRAFPDEKTAETSLIRGQVEVTLRNSPDKKIILKPNEKLVVQNITETQTGDPSRSIDTDNRPLLILSKLHHLNGDSSAVETSWVKNKLAFESETLEDVSGKIEKWYGVKIIIKDESLKEGQYTGEFEDETLQEVLGALKLTGDFKFEINKKEVLIYNK